MDGGSRRPLRIDSVTEDRRSGVQLRYPRGEQERAEAAAGLVDVLRPVVERYLGAPWEGVVRLELLAEARASGANPVTGTLRHALRGFEERSPRAAGELSYELGRIHFYRSSREEAFPGAGPRHPDWLLEAALLPLRYIWDDRDRWVEALSEQVALFRWRKPLPEPLLRDMGRLGPRQRVVASAQCLLRGQTLALHHPDWVRAWRARLAQDVSLDGERALQLVTGTTLPVWEQRFEEDLERATRTLRSAPPGGW